MENNEKKTNIFYPSFIFEKRTKAFNKYIWWFVSLISIFTISLLIFTMFHTFMCWFLNLVSTFIQDNFTIIVFLPIIIYIVLSYQFFQWLTSLMTSYKFEEGKIIKGKIQKADKVNGVDLVIDTALLANMINNISNSSSVVASNATSNLNKITNLIRLNINPEFVEKYFDTELYKKQVYENPKLVRTTKYSLIYECDNNKKLVIPKIYEGICDTDNQKESSFIGRILIKSAIVFIIALIIAVVDLSIGYHNNKEYVSSISNVKSTIEQKFNYYGYTSKKINEKMYRFTKELENGDRTSEVSYYFDKNGNVKDVDIQLYYNSTSKNVDNELTYIISTINDKFDSNEVSNFINLVKENIAGNYKYGNLKSENYKLILSRSSGYVDIHNY